MLRALFENTTAGIAEIDAETGRFLSVNRYYCQIVGRTRAELLGGLRIDDVLHPDDDRVPLCVAEARGNAERRYLQPNGQIVWVRISVAVTSRDAFGRATRISSIVQDVTESHAAQDKLRASEALLRLSLEIGQVGCFSRDIVAGEIRCGDETRAMLGFPPGETPVAAEAWLAAILPEDREALLA
ncbi:MAG: PAS domain S-box protein, partial [Pseudomonadota bacterium]|nr:PAS domain S-box protein [Pseudomonadota bacterium]